MSTAVGNSVSVTRVGATETTSWVLKFETFCRVGLIALFGTLLFTFDVGNRFREAAVGCEGVDVGGGGGGCGPAKWCD